MTEPREIAPCPDDLIVEADYACCALKDGHDGCCAYRCSTCDGAGRLGCYPDDLGCECGMCDGMGYCPECGGNGWFNEDGDQCMAPTRDELP